MSATTPCPEPEVLAAFAEGKVARKELPRIFAHLETCADCRSGVAAAGEAVAPARSFRFRFALPLAAAAVIVLAVGLVPWALSVRSPFVRLEKLAPRSARAVETRLSADIPWAAYRGPMRASTGAAPDPARLKLGGEVGEIVDRADREQTASWQHAAGVGLVLYEMPADAVGRLQAAAALERGNPRIWSDLAAAQYAAALRLDRPSLYPEALASADQALRLDPRLPEALFNRALVLERLGLKAQARDAWNRYLAVDGSSPWAVEARQRLARLPVSTSEERFRTELPRLERAAAAGDATTVRAVVDAYRQQTRTTAEVVTLGKWAEAHQRGDAAAGERSLAVARSIGEMLQTASGESLLRDAVATIEQTPDARARLAEAHVVYLRGRLAYSRRQPASAEPDLRRAASLFAAAANPMALVARYYAACIRYDLNDVAGASGELARLLEEVEARPSYIALAAQVRWQLALCAMVDGDWQAATSLLQASRASFARLGERSNGGFLDALLANALGAMGRADDDWAARIRSFEALSGEGQSDRVPASLSEAATMELRAGRPEVARSLLEIEEAVNRASGFDVLLAYGLVRATVLSVNLGDPATASLKATDAERTARGIADPALRTRALADASLALGAATADRAALTRAIDGYQAIERPAFLPEARLFRARTELRDGNVEAALRDVDAGIAELERHRIHYAGSVSGRGVFDAGTEIFRLGMRLALDRGDTAGAFSYAERSRAYFVAKDGDPPAIGAEALQARLAGSGTAVLELVVLPEELLAFCITADSVRVARSAVSSVQLAKLVSQDDADGRLYDWLIRPSEAGIAAAQQLIVVPDPVLEGVSFAGLWDAREKRHLIERLAVAVAPSASALRRETGARHLQSVTAIALPTGEQGENVALPQASAELGAIASLYGNAVVLGGSSATLESFRTHARDAAVIHIAGHTERRGRAGESALAFLGPRGHGLEYVSWRGLVAMTLRSHPVVVLAACETLQRPRSPQTFALSLGGGFLAAGAPEVIGTLVPLADNDARALFEDVHRELRAGFTPAEALRRTQLRALGDPQRRSLPWQALALLTNRIRG